MNGSTKVAGWLLPIIAGAGSGLMQGAATGFAPNAPAQPVNWAPAGTNTQQQAAANSAELERAKADLETGKLVRYGIMTVGILGAVGILVAIIKAFTTPTRSRR